MPSRYLYSLILPRYPVYMVNATMERYQGAFEGTLVILAIAALAYLPYWAFWSY